MRRNHNLLNGAGLALGDVDGDGRPDIYFVGMDGTDALYRNLGNWRFKDVTVESGLRTTNRLGRGAALADVDGDGDLDLIRTYNSLGTRLFINDGKGVFRDAGLSSLQARAGTTSLALGDLDGDGDLDLYVTNYGENTIRSGMVLATRLVNGREQVVGRHRNRLKIIDGEIVEYGEPDALYLNDGLGNFVPADLWKGMLSDERGTPIVNPYWDLGLSVMIRDINGDGAPDIYVCNDFQDPDRIWINDGNGRFKAIRREAIRSISQFSMGVDFGDINRDGLDDFFVVDMLSRFHQHRITQIAPRQPPIQHTGELDFERPQVRRNTLFLNRGDGTYAEIGRFSGVESADWAWCPVFLDVDLDGFEDILVVNGHLYDTQDMDAIALNSARGKASGNRGQDLLELFPKLETPNFAFHNRGDLTFAEVGEQWGFHSMQVSHGLALSDLDGDGDLDMVVSALNAPPLIYRNNATEPRVAVRLAGLPPNTRGIGARIKVLDGAVPLQQQEMICGGRYLSSDDPIRAFAAGTLTNDLTLEVTWRSGKKSVVRGGRANRIYEIAESGAVLPNPLPPNDTVAIAALFTNVNRLINHVHVDEKFDDFQRQPLLPRLLSQSGPGVSWFDVNEDGLDDLLISSGTRGSLGVFVNDGAGGFSGETEAFGNALVKHDETAILGFYDQDGSPALAVGVSNYETAADKVPSARIRRFGEKMDSVELPPQSAVTGPMAFADIDGDGDLDLFIGGRAIRGEYPRPADSLVLKNDHGRFVIDTLNSQTLAHVGLVSGAVFSDLNADGAPDLVLACEWGPVRVFINRDGKLEERTAELGLGGLIGWWNGVATGDIDGDGRPDIVASNWGLNTDYRPAQGLPLRIYYGDFDQSGSLDLLENSFDERTNREVPRRGLADLRSAMPLIGDLYPTHHAYAQASLQDVLGNAFATAGKAEANWLQSTVFFNRDLRFEPAPLPQEAQLAPAFGVIVADFDGDAAEDVFLSQNFFASRPPVHRCDAGRGLLLKGDGRGNLRAMAGQESGLVIYGEQRGCAASDYDKDGRLDLVVTQNRAATQLFRNVNGKPGLRVRLRGSDANPTAVGASVRVGAGEQLGPVREVQSGGGYCSQNSHALIFGNAHEINRVWVRWPGGRTTIGDVPKGAREIVVDAAGQVAVVR